MSTLQRARIGRWVRRALGGALLLGAGLALMAYGVDYGVFRYRVAGNRGFGQVTVTNYDAVQQKNGKTQFLFDAPQTVACVNALFPRAGFTPCWYLSRHAERRTDI